MFNINTGQSFGNLRIQKMLIFETGTYNQQFRRPFDTGNFNISGKTINNIISEISAYDRFSPAVMSNVANQFVAPSATPECSIAIPNGWDTRRYRFMLAVESTLVMGIKSIELILGYTEYPGISGAGHIDPGMQFIINSVMSLRETVTRTPTGNSVIPTVTDSSHILCNNDTNNTIEAYSSGVTTRMRPEDVFSIMSRGNLAGNPNMFDARTAMSGIAVKSNRLNNSPTNYMSRILSGYQAGAMMNDGSGESALLSEARRSMAENSTIDDAFMKAISHVRGGIISNIFTFNDLKQLDPNVENVTVCRTAGSAQQTMGLHQAGFTANWGQSDGTTYAANILAQAIPGLLMELGLTRMIFKATNRTFNSDTLVAIIDNDGFVGGDTTRQCEMFKLRVVQEILNNFSHNNIVDYDITVNVDLLGETWVSISYGSPESYDYVVPSFCDALIVPVISNNNTLIDNLASDFQVLSSMLLENYNTQSPFGNGHSGQATNSSNKLY